MSVEIKDTILKRCAENNDIWIENDKEYYFCVGNVLQDLKKCSKESIKIEQSLKRCASPVVFDKMFKNYAKKCTVTGLGLRFRKGTKKRKMLAALFTYNPKELDIDTFLDGYIMFLK